MAEIPRDRREFYQKVLPEIGEKLHCMLTLRLQAGKRSPVDCVAFGYAYVSTGENSEITAYHHAICQHPERGQQYGCLLTREESDGTVTRVVHTKCENRIKNGKRGASALKRTIEEVEETLPF